MDLFNFCNENNDEINDENKNKYVRFNTIVQVILIPSIHDDYIKKNKDMIWYNDESYKYFINDEINRLKNKNIRNIKNITNMNRIKISIIYK